MLLRLAAAVLLPALALADPESDIDYDSFQLDFPDDAGDSLDEVEDELAANKRQLRSGRHAKMAFLKHEHHLDQWAEDGDAADLVDDTLAAPMALPGRHPAVEKALDGMAGDLENLKEKKFAAKDARGELEGSIGEAVFHMNDAMAIKQAMAKQEAQLRREDGKLKVLEMDAAQLDSTHNNLVSSLHRMIGPKLMFARERFEKKKGVFMKEEQAANAWKEKKDQLKASALELIKQKKASHQSLLEAEEEVAQAKKKEQLARMRYERDRKKTAEEVQSYRYAETRFKAEEQHEKAAKTAALAARESVEKLHHVYEAEHQKVDDSMGYRKHKLDEKIHEVEEAREKSTKELTGLKQKYQEWQEKQRERTAAVVEKSQATAAASEAYAARQKQVLDSAQAKVAREAEAAGDWDGWGNDMTKAQDESDNDDDDPALDLHL